MASLSDPGVRDFLGHGTRTGKLSWLSASGRPLVALILLGQAHIRLIRSPANPVPCS